MRFLHLVLTVILGLLVAGGCALPGRAPAAAVPSVPTPVPLPGVLIYSRDGNLWVLTLWTGQERQLTTFPPGSYAVYPALSPDGRSIAFSLFEPSADPKTPTGTDLYVVGRDGTAPRRVLAHETADTSLEMPTWTPDGRALYFTYRAPRFEKDTFVGETIRVERVNLDGSGRTPVVEGAASPTVSPDGRRLLWVKVHPESGTSQLWTSDPDGGQPRRFLEDDGFKAFLAPRFSPDGKRVLFSAVGPSNGTPVPTPKKTSRRTADPWGWLGGPAAAEAHGIVWDFWVVGSDGIGLRRLTDLTEDNPIGTWSPDGQSIALLGEHGLVVIRADGSDLVRVAQPLGGAGLTWAPDE